MQINSLMLGSRWDYVPVIGGGVAAVQLFGRCFSTEVSEVGRHRYGVLAPGGIARAICLLLPVIGNIVIFVYDLVRERAFNRVSADGLALRDLWEGFQDDEEIVKAAVRQNKEALEYARAEFKDDRDVVLAAVRQDGSALAFASDTLKNDRDFVLEAVRLDSVVLYHANAEFRNDRDFMLEAVSQNGWAIECASDALRNDRGVVLAAVMQDRGVFMFVSDELKHDRDFMLEAVRQDGWALQDASDALKDDEGVVRAAIANQPDALDYASARVQGVIGGELKRVGL